MVRYCSVYGCLEASNTNKHRRFFSFPSDEPRCKHWIKSVCRKDLESKDVNTLHTSYFVCDIHFADSDCPNKYLKVNAVPTLFLPQLDEASGSSKYTQTEVNLMCCSCDSQISAENRTVLQTSDAQTQTTKILIEDIPMAKKLRLELKSERKLRRLVESKYEKVTNKGSRMPPLLKKIIDASKRNSQGARYDHEYMMFASNIYSASPVVYQILSEVLCLPAVRTLQRQKQTLFGTDTK